MSSLPRWLVGLISFCVIPSRAQYTGPVRFEGSRRYPWQRTLSCGLREQVVCDGDTLSHLYRPALYRQLAETDWQPRFRHLRQQARWQIDRR